MNTNQLKKFAQEARRKLLEQVGAKLNFVLTTDSAELREKTEQLKQLRLELGRTTKEQLIEKVAYTWFNRLMALRFMDVNDYQPLGIRVITPKDGYTTPELLDEAKRGNIPEELKLNRQRIYDILDNRIPSKNPQNEAYKELLIAACNHLHTAFSFLFEKINDYTELLLPDDLTSDFSIVTDVREGMLSEDCQNVEIIGWLYQFYISEEKDRLINAKKRYKAHEIAPVTQLFTPKWIVQYMVDNTLGQFWKEARPKTNIINILEFYINPESVNLIPQRELKSIEDLTFFDPCVGSGHILCYAFDVLFKIYQEEGYTDSEISEHIIKNNLWGVDIDERAVQLAGFAIMMKGCQYNRRFLKKKIIPNITAFRNVESYAKFENAETFGSLIQISQLEVDKIVIEENSLFIEQQKQLKRQATFLAKTYDILVTNPPYMNSSYMDGRLKQFVETNYEDTKSDLFASFLIQATKLTKANGLIGFISPYVWMFITSYEKLREHIINKTTISTLIQLEYNAFEPACVPVATFTLRNYYLNNYKGSYIKLSDFKGYTNQAPKTIEAIHDKNCGWYFSANQKDFMKIPSSPLGYWKTEKTIKCFEDFPSLGTALITREGMATSNNDRFMRLWFEVAKTKIGLNINSSKEAIISKAKWFPYNKGGQFRKWSGNNYFVVNWHNDGEEIKNNKDLETGRIRSHNYNGKYAFRKGITWSALSSSSFSARWTENGYLFDSKGAKGFFEKDGEYILALLNSKVSQSFLDVLAPTLDYKVGDIIEIPYRLHNEEKIKVLVTECLTLSKNDWDTSETSLDFQNNEILRISGSSDLELEEVFDNYQQSLKIRFLKLHQIEEELNREFISIYGLTLELTPYVLLQDISILEEELDRNALANLNKLLIRNVETLTVDNYYQLSLPLNWREVITQFISYSIGCMFGRYSLDKEGLVLANQGETLQDFLKIIANSKNDCTYIPDEDNIIPVLDDDWFEDDIVAKFYRFLKVTFGEKNFNKNLPFIEEQIGKDIRKYFIKDFYPDHIKRYKKRPIYWLFSSPKGSFNVLIYMHRYIPDTVSNILNKYLKEFIGKLNNRKEHLENVQVTGSASEKNKAIKEIDSIVKTLAELHDYERDILYPLATERIEIDLDDGVLVNYNKFGKAVKEVNGLNDPATKKKVKQFDWINTSQIR